MGHNPLRLWRESQEQKVTTMEAAGLFDVSTHAIYAWETGASRPSEDNLDRLSRVIPEVREAWTIWESERPVL